MSRRARRWGSGYQNRRIARAYAETIAGVECGLGFGFRRPARWPFRIANSVK